MSQSELGCSGDLSTLGTTPPAWGIAMKDDRLLEMRIFKTVVEAGGFTAAAHVLNVSQPFVSQTINSLERRLGVQLLARSTRTQRLTSEGERYLASCNDLLDAVDQAEARIRSSEPTGDLRVSVPQAFGIDQIVPALPGFLVAYPKLTVRFSLSDSQVNLIEDNFDVAVRMGHRYRIDKLGGQPGGLRQSTTWWAGSRT